jgi:hypothetical protein
MQTLRASLKSSPEESNLHIKGQKQSYSKEVKHKVDHAPREQEKLVVTQCDANPPPLDSCVNHINIKVK